MNDLVGIRQVCTLFKGLSIGKAIQIDLQLIGTRLLADYWSNDDAGIIEIKTLAGIDSNRLTQWLWRQLSPWCGSKLYWSQGILKSPSQI